MQKELSQIAEVTKKKRKELGLSQEEFCQRVGGGLRFLRELEQGKETLRLDKINLVLNYFGYELTATERTRANE